MTVLFPRRLLQGRRHSWNLVGTARASGDTARNASQMVRSDGGGFWKCSMTDIPLAGDARGTITGKDRQKLYTLLWRAVRQIGKGGVTPLIVERLDILYRPWPAGYALDNGLDVPHDDDTLFDDDTGYYQPTTDVTADAAALRATSLDITLNNAGQLWGGESFSINHDTMDHRLYEIATIEMTSANTATITIEPPLREAIAGGTYLEFDRPKCKMRLANTDSMDLTMAPWTFNSASVEFVESP